MFAVRILSAVQDEASRSKVGLTAGKMELDARMYIADILGPALAANHKLGLAAGLLQVHTGIHAIFSCVLSLEKGQKKRVSCFPRTRRKVEKSRISPKLCQVLKSVQCTMQVDDWENASKLLNLLDSQKLDPMAFPPIARELCKLVQKRLEPSFKALYPDGPRGLCILNRKVLACFLTLVEITFIFINLPFD